MAKDRSRPSEAVRITTAATTRGSDIAARQKRYIVAMTIRTLCVIGAAISGAAGIDWLWPVLIAAGVFLPYVAVVEANAAETRSDAFELPDSNYRHELGNGPTPPPAPHDPGHRGPTKDDA
ncbi:DUF3099 domain-containing protein [Nocardioides sp. dk4132]|uniref:DUF3099 domain-containing protein n=1 Tax=unclassified Nocardioides TaxID=2615069 RepID=UPI00129776E8|nr:MULTISPECIES: DUF3099 domain-containing protein [unclassified Nocardioides]MQW75094.1 DUF3099 domain-containing protein [Nocardioides sp. dk4132]QGA07739.1 DUF3099 domain-containing protein [Nocardioides sp. dk884]